MAKHQFVMKILRLAKGGTTEYDNTYLVDYNPTPLETGEVLLSVCRDRAGARKFENAWEATKLWNSASLKGAGPDGLAVQPLKAYTVEIK